MNFSELLYNEQSRKEMLELLILETEKDMQVLVEVIEKEDRKTLSLLVHHLLPLWEIVRADIPLRELDQVLAEGNEMKDEKVQNAMKKVIATGKELTIQASEKIKEDGYE